MEKDRLHSASEHANASLQECQYQRCAIQYAGIPEFVIHPCSSIILILFLSIKHPYLFKVDDAISLDSLSPRKFLPKPSSFPPSLACPFHHRSVSRVWVGRDERSRCKSWVRGLRAGAGGVLWRPFWRSCRRICWRRNARKVWRLKPKKRWSNNWGIWCHPTCLCSPVPRTRGRLGWGSI